MKSAGELVWDFLHSEFNKDLVKKARDYSSLSSSWARITQKNKIASAAYHSRIKNLERDVVLVEADHPGWVQLLHTKQRQLLVDIQQGFPELTIAGISFMLSRTPIEDAALDAVSAVNVPAPAPAPALPARTEGPDNNTPQDEEFRAILKRLGDVSEQG
jgi:hypothetical protein